MGKEPKNANNNARRRVYRGTQEPADWSTVSPEIIGGAVRAVTRIGGAIRFGYTRDGGAYAVGIYGDGEPYTDFVRPGDDVSAYLEGVIHDFDNMAAKPASSTAA